jgi:hypothetical protein
MTPTEATNGRIASVREDIMELISWAEADAEQSLEDNSGWQAKADLKRAEDLRQALKILQFCDRL